MKAKKMVKKMREFDTSELTAKQADAIREASLALTNGAVLRIRELQALPAGFEMPGEPDGARPE